MANSTRDLVVTTGLSEQGNRDASSAQGDKQGTNSNGDAAGNDEAQGALVPDFATVETVGVNQQSHQAEFRAQADLQAQQDMAFYALLMVIVTAFTVAITAIGVWLVKRTLDATLEAVEDTGHATAAMIRQNEIAEVSARPWLTLEMDHGFARSNDEDLQILFFANLKITNVGGTPAQNVSVHTAEVPDVVRNEFTDLQIISENLESDFSDLEHLIVFPSSTEIHQVIFSAPFVGRGAGVAAHPDILIVVNYRLGNGQTAQTSARFFTLHGDDRREIVRGEPIPKTLRFERVGYIRAR